MSIVLHLVFALFGAFFLGYIHATWYENLRYRFFMFVVGSLCLVSNGSIVVSVLTKV
jgi:hypothetical protein